MTEVEFSRLFSELSDTAKTLNRKSDSVNALIKRFQDSLQAINVGIEVWVTLRYKTWTRMDEDGEQEVARGSHVTELGFIKHDGQWILAVRSAVYEDDPGYNSQTLINTGPVTPLLEIDRAGRIEALGQFPGVAKALKAEAQKAIETIEAVEKYVK